MVDVAWLGQAECLDVWGDAMLNADAEFCRLDGLAEAVGAVGPRVFVRPAHDTKAFEALVLDAADATSWLASHAPDLPPDTPCVAARPKVREALRAEGLVKD